MVTIKRVRNQVRAGTVTEGLLGNVIFSFNRRAKLEYDSKEYLYRMKAELLRHFFSPKEIHILNGKKYLYYEINIYKFHIPYASFDYQYKNLQVFLMDRNNPPKRRKMSCLPIEDCFYLYNNKEQVCLAS